MMKKVLFTLLLPLLLGCGCSGSASGGDGKTPGSGKTSDLVKGADIGWVSEMESKGYKFYDKTGAEKECTALLKSIGFNAVRCRVWVNPSDGWNSEADVLVKAARARDLGMKVMIDFHFSDTWADPGAQNPPEAWKSMSVDEMTGALTAHVSRVLGSLKAAGIDVSWVQIGNEVTNGMLWESGRVQGSDAAGFVKYFNAGRAAAKAVYPEAGIILHVDNGWKAGTLDWFFSLMKTYGADYDMIGLSLYPSCWDEEAGAYPDWRIKTAQCLANMKTLHETYSKPVMLVEFGMPASKPAETAAALSYLMDGTEGLDWFKGIFYWEPEAEHSRNGYDYGAFSDGRPTSALAPFED